MNLTRLFNTTFLILVLLLTQGSLIAHALELSSTTLTEETNALKEQELFDFAMVVDNTKWPSVAAAIEVRPFSNIIEKVRIGGGEKTLRPLGSFGFSRAKLLKTPELFRGEIVFAHGLIVQLERAKNLVVKQQNDEILYRGVLASIRVRRGRPQINYWAFCTLRRKNDAPLYTGDRVNLSGYFFKRIPLVDATAHTHWMPLVIAPWPSYPIKRTSSSRHTKKSLPNWIPLSLAVKQVGLTGLLPFSEIPHEQVWSRLIIDFENGVPVAADGVKCGRSVIILELRRYLRTDPERVVLLRRDKNTTQETLRELMLEVGVIRAEIQNYTNLRR